MKLFARLCPLHLSVWLCTTTTTTYHAVQGWAAPPVVSTVSNQQRHQRQNGGGGVVTATNPPTKTVASVGWESFALLAATPKNDVASSAVTSTLTNDNYDDGASSVLTPSLQQTQSVVEQLKLILEREYLSFFNPMEQAYYAPDVTFDDPLTQLQGVRSYQNNVDMLAGRTWLGTLLFQDASIQLHSVTGGMVSTTTTSTPPTTTPTTTPSSSSGLEIQDIVTRWTLRFTFRALPWKPTARFSGISVYKVVVVDSSTGPGVQIVQQTDYWDAINLLPSASTVASTTSTETGVESAGATQQQQQPQDQYRSVPKSVAVRHFVDQLQPGGWAAIAAGPELPFSTLRVIPGDYEVRRYPSYSAVKILKYQRRDEAFSVMGLLTRGT